MATNCRPAIITVVLALTACKTTGSVSRASGLTGGPNTPLVDVETMFADPASSSIRIIRATYGNRSEYAFQRLALVQAVKEFADWIVTATGSGSNRSLDKGQQATAIATLRSKLQKLPLDELLDHNFDVSLTGLQDAPTNVAPPAPWQTPAEVVELDTYLTSFNRKIDNYANSGRVDPELIVKNASFYLAALADYAARSLTYTQEEVHQDPRWMLNPMFILRGWQWMSSDADSFAKATRSAANTIRHVDASHLAQDDLIAILRRSINLANNHFKLSMRPWSLKIGNTYNEADLFGAANEIGLELALLTKYPVDFLTSDAFSMVDRVETYKQFAQPGLFDRPLPAQPKSAPVDINVVDIQTVPRKDSANALVLDPATGRPLIDVFHKQWSIMIGLDAKSDGLYMTRANASGKDTDMQVRQIALFGSARNWVQAWTDLRSGGQDDAVQLAGLTDLMSTLKALGPSGGSTDYLVQYVQTKIDHLQSAAATAPEAMPSSIDPAVMRSSISPML